MATLKRMVFISVIGIMLVLIICYPILQLEGYTTDELQNIQFDVRNNSDHEYNDENINQNYHYFVEMHRKDSHNIGDLYASPFHYFPHFSNNKIASCDCLHWNFAILDIISDEFFHSFLNLNFHKSISEYNIHIGLVVGGGGLFNHWFAQCLSSIHNILSNYSSFQIAGIEFQGNNVTFNVKISAYTFAIGLNNIQHSPDQRYNATFWNYFELYSLITIRDYYFIQKEANINNELDLKYSQCASSMLSLLKNNYTIQFDICFFEHAIHRTRYRDLVSKKGPLKYTVIKNSNMDIKKVITKLGQCKYVITASYHGMVWATLLNKRVIAKNIVSNKFDYFRYPAVRYEKECEDISFGECLNKTVNYENALDESIDSVMNAYQLIVDDISDISKPFEHLKHTEVKKYDMSDFHTLRCSGMNNDGSNCVCMKFNVDSP